MRLVDALGGLGRDADRAARRRSTTGCRRRGSRDRWSRPTSRMRAGNGPARRLVMANTLDSQPGLEEPAELEDRRIEPFDVADLDRARRSRARPSPGRPPPRWWPRAASRRAPRCRDRWPRVTRSSDASSSGEAMTTASRSASASIDQRLAYAWAEVVARAVSRRPPAGPRSPRAGRPADARPARAGGCDPSRRARSTRHGPVVRRSGSSAAHRSAAPAAVGAACRATAARPRG